MKRVYDTPEPEDGYRVLVDRIWPRGVSKERAAVDEWLQVLGPSTELRTWFGHDSSRWAGFVARYEDELRAKTNIVDGLFERAGGRSVTLVYSAHDEIHNQAVALAAFLRGRT